MRKMEIQLRVSLENLRLYFWGKKMFVPMPANSASLVALLVMPLSA